MSDLKPCPFCGDDAMPHVTELTMPDGSRRYNVGCSGICGSLLDCREQTPDDAAASWNRRVKDGEIERLRNAVTNLRLEINSLVDDGIISSGRAAEMQGMTVSEWRAGCETVPGESYTRGKRELATLRAVVDKLPEDLRALAEYLDDDAYTYPLGARSTCQNAADELEDWRDTQRNVMSESCEASDDRRHCTCVPVLRREIERLRAENAALRSIVDKLPKTADGALHDEYPGVSRVDQENTMNGYRLIVKVLAATQSGRDLMHLAITREFGLRGHGNDGECDPDCPICAVWQAYDEAVKAMEGFD